MYRSGDDRHVPHRVVRALEMDPSVGERLNHDFQRLAQPFGPLAKSTPVQAHAVVLVFNRAAADPELEPARRDLIEGARHLGQHRGMAKLIAQHHVSDTQALGAAEQRGRHRPGFQRGDLGRAGAVHVVVKPHRSDAQLLAAHRAVQNIFIRERHLRHVHANVEPSHDRNSNLPWLIVFTSLHVASNATARSSMR